MTKIDDFQYILDQSEKITFFLGKEVSLLNGSKDYKNKEQSYKRKYLHSPSRILTEEYFDLHPDIFYDFLYKRIINNNPSNDNYVYEFIRNYQLLNKVKGVISQNIDGIIKKKSIKNLCMLFGTVNQFYCVSCRKRYNFSEISRNDNSIPYCECYGYLRPDITLFDEMIKEEKIKQAISYLENSDTLLVIGTDLKYLKESNLLDYFKGKKIIVINRYKSKINENADLEIAESINNCLKEISIR